MGKAFYYVDENGDGEDYCQECGHARLRADYPAIMKKEHEEDYMNGVEFSQRAREFTDRPLQCANGAECHNRVKSKGQWVGAMLDCPLSPAGKEWLKSKEARNTISYPLWLNFYGVEIGLKIFKGDES